MFYVAYTNIEYKIKINGLLSDPLTPVCVRQGCLLSMLLYNIVAEALANLINADKRIKGIQIGDHEIRIVNFTDNTTIFLRDITWGAFKKYVCSRFLSFEPPPPLFALARFQAHTTTPSPLPNLRSFWLELTLFPSISIIVKFR